ncbi:Ppx/GppA phosphatase family protein [Ornithinicoccus hortensis]|uniref:Exopolyphosphatase/guanosine-5'-triphosphate, 3'-diphosphate pyrophosphatase n=1 Tax=Ornithinicoccus hortensis TaxID=82346 RepID=A0A542YVG7_9MICO|nr:Ppx/GppA phosphatase family protein [Ornithinicoccus hortensis]TQL52079.1 exopolyphosphatase/guanosine-5'-triphosphate,3'-diphosphate pyrophosphatase [Ornithinicoccus hortensis]
MTRVGAVDCGTNSIRLLIADVTADGALSPVTRQMEIVRLGQGVDATGRIAPESMVRTLAAAERYAAECTGAGCASVRFVATSASRDAENAAEFTAGIERAFAAFGTTPEVVTGDEEASLSFAGATGDLRSGGVAAPYLVVDIGGGSTEFVRGTDAVEAALSVDIGCVRMTERHLHSDPPTEEEVWPALGDIAVATGRAAEAVDFSGVATLVGLAGSVTTVTAHALGLDSYRPERIHGAQLPVDEAIAACSDLVRMTRAERAALPFMHEGRVDVIGAGALVWRTVIQQVQRDAGITTVRASEHDILDGIALSQASPA